MSEPPRYQPHRDLPAAAFLPGRAQRGSRSARPPAAPALQRADPPPNFAAEDWRLDAEYLWGVDLYNLGFFWEAHEAWEAPWRAAEHDPGQRLFLQGLIQCAAACLKARVGQPPAKRRLTDRGLARLAQVQREHGNPYMGLDLARFVPAFREFSELPSTASPEPPRIHLALERAT